MIPRIPVILAIAAALALSACGSSDDTPTKAEYIKKADAVCKAAEEKIDAGVQKEFGNRQPSPAEIAAYQKGTIIPALEQQSKDLRALEKPKDDEDELNAIYDSLDASLERAKTAPTVDSADFADSRKKAQAYGLEECGSGN